MTKKQSQEENTFMYQLYSYRRSTLQDNGSGFLNDISVKFRDEIPSLEDLANFINSQQLFEDYYHGIQLVRYDAVDGTGNYNTVPTAKYDMIPVYFEKYRKDNEMELQFTDEKDIYKEILDNALEAFGTVIVLIV